MTNVGVIKGGTGNWEVVIGLEIHAQVISASKLFSGSSADFCADPNVQVSLFDVAMPGTLPVLNTRCVEQAVRTALALSCVVHKRSVFDRKNYFYPDLALGYQITQFYFPIATDGFIALSECCDKRIRISRIHLEQDAGKSIHAHDKTYLDFNRAGVALMEIVSEPDLRSPEEAAEYLKKLRVILRSIGTCDGDMERGSLRCDANVSVRRVGDDRLGVRSEIKNLNSIKHVAHAIKYEAHRQVEILESVGALSPSTMLFDVDTGSTRVIRDKEDACDYRYFPDPDLLPLDITEAFIDGVRASLPELPLQKKERYMRDMGLSEYDADILSSDKDVSTYFESVITGCSPDLAVSWITGELFGALNKCGLGIAASPVSAESLTELLNLIANGTISGKMAKQVFALMFETGQSAPDIVREQKLCQITSEEALAPVVDSIINQNPDKVAEYRQGKVKLLGYFVGQVMKETNGQANPELVNALIKRRLVED
ncbi:Asp-tRNA(Asn)/Glu-tRNA(Gln) amidotransferase subunit GatB [Anaplasma capra]|uniref:Asp-tRNA(Asn)/Glu-tRNA(Gln) amidotransferase subunit GatB n=1 Tax=Anaplasma capra TaxID=1562740 RepID=UPI0021D5B06A|nr:Asp-tRNA(Asn)/Glu-tRNA(Gln) amidotransferase subunit GatB [Anaplasma capra]MCU7611435.1 Asp-tRNA(Asn)/Glu-tRNA(Gln) amidotransferase subunit GatB [Anaplasma capra]MCU7612126.1 Asp-tRNA(Asn)/Glu-tRNA(Gln) amidotransferase subunit GatB [Anaplasma capra]